MVMMMTMMMMILMIPIPNGDNVPECLPDPIGAETNASAPNYTAIMHNCTTVSLHPPSQNRKSKQNQRRKICHRNIWPFEIQ
eukprot:12426640-Karenia_brevis.AAC.1